MIYNVLKSSSATSGQQPNSLISSPLRVHQMQHSSFGWPSRSMTCYIMQGKNSARCLKKNTKHAVSLTSSPACEKQKKVVGGRSDGKELTGNVSCDGGVFGRLGSGRVFEKSFVGYQKSDDRAERTKGINKRKVTGVLHCTYKRVITEERRQMKSMPT